MRLNIYLDDPSKEPSTTEPYNECEDFQCMFESTLNGQRVIYCAEMDGIESDELLDLENCDLNKCKFVELKLSSTKIDRNDKYDHKFLRHCWSQCFLVKVNKVIVGMRRGNTVTNLSYLDIADIPRLAKVFALFNFFL